MAAGGALNAEIGPSPAALCRNQRALGRTAAARRRSAARSRTPCARREADIAMQNSGGLRADFRRAT
jgi:hypothetical protein